MKIILVSSGSGSRGGGEIYLRLLAEGLASAGHVVTALVPEAGRMDELAASIAAFAHVVRFPFRATYERPLRPLGAVLDRSQRARLAALFASLGADVIHVNQQVAEDGLDLVLAAVASGVPWVSTVHVARSSASLGARVGVLRDFIAIAALRRANGPIIAVSDASRRQLAARFGSNAPPLHVVHNGVSVPNEKALTEARAVARAAWGAGDEVVVVGAVGRIEAQKNPLALVDYLTPVVGDARLLAVWIGDGAMRSDLEKRAARFTEAFPLVVDGWRQDAATRLAGLDISLLPSHFEGLPLALLEAMHAGLPVIAARADGIVEAVLDGKTGWTCLKERDWTTALKRLVTDANLRARFGSAGRRDALNRFSVATMTAGTTQVYQSAMRRVPPRGA